MITTLGAVGSALTLLHTVGVGKTVFGLVSRLGFRFAGMAVLGVSALGLVAWITHSIQSGAAAKVELTNIRQVANDNAQRATELAKAYDRKHEAEQLARNQVAARTQQVSELQQKLEAIPAEPTTQDCDLECTLPKGLLP